MPKDYAIALGAIILAFSFILLPVYYFAEKEEEWLVKHNCKMIHKNPDYYSWEYNAGLKMMEHKRHIGKKFYECDNGEWH